jgi:hypothetical protein
MKNTENKVFYFTDDVGLNTFNTYYRLYYPSWFNVTKYGRKIDRRGEMFLYKEHQLYSRYVMERRSSGMPDIEPFVYNKPLKVLMSAKLHQLNQQYFSTSVT